MLTRIGCTPTFGKRVLTNDCVNDHEGDWEHINVIINSQDPSTASIVGIDYYFHKKTTYAYQSGDYYVIDNTHPVVFVGGYCSVAGNSGPGSHGSYPVKGRWSDIGKLDADEDVHGDGRYIHHTGLDVFVLPHNPNVIDYMRNKKMCWLKANIPWGHWDVEMKHDWLEFIWELGNAPPVGPYYNAYDENTEKGKAWIQTGSISGDYDTYNENWPYRPVTNSDWNPPSVVTAPEPPELIGANRSGSQVTLSWTNKSGTAGTKIYYSQEPRFDRFYEYNGTGLSEGNSPIVINSSTINSYTLHGLSGSYYFALRSYNSNGESWFSNELIATKIRDLFAFRVHS